MTHSSVGTRALRRSALASLRTVRSPGCTDHTGDRELCPSCDHGLRPVTCIASRSAVCRRWHSRSSGSRAMHRIHPVPCRISYGCTNHGLSSGTSWGRRRGTSAASRAGRRGMQPAFLDLHGCVGSCSARSLPTPPDGLSAIAACRRHAVPSALEFVEGCSRIHLSSNAGLV